MTTDDLAGILAEHGNYEYVSRTTIACKCKAEFQGGALEFGDFATADPVWFKHVAAVIAAAGWVNGRQEWGLRYETTRDPTMDNPSGEVTVTSWLQDEATVRQAVARKVPLSVRNRRAVRRYVTEPEEA